MGKEGGSGWGTRVHPWWIHVDVWQNQYSIVKEKKIKLKKKKKEESEKAGLKLNIEKTKHGICSHHFMANRRGKSRSSDSLFSWTPKSLQMVMAAMKLKATCSLEGKL